jgi:hypothetical protein
MVAVLVVCMIIKIIIFNTQTITTYSVFSRKPIQEQVYKKLGESGSSALNQPGHEGVGT